MTATEKACSICFSWSKEAGYSWMRIGEEVPDGTLGAGGYEKLTELFLDLDFLNVLESSLGNGSVPPALLAIAEERARGQKEQQFPFSAEVLNALEKEWGIKIQGR